MNEANYEIAVFSRPGCFYCDAVMDFFEELGVKYIELSADDENATAPFAEILDLPIDGVPTIVINKKHLVVGYDRPKLTKILKKEGITG